MPDNLVIESLRKYRLAMDALDAELMEELARRWLAMERRLQNEVDALAAIMVQRAAAGETITQQMIWKAERYQILRAQMDAELLRYNREAAVLIADYQKQAAQLGIDAAQDALLLSYPSPLSVAFTQINIDAVNAMIGFAKDGSPLYSLLAKSFEEVVVTAILDGMIADLAMGKSAIEIARGIMDAAGMGLDRAMLIARTETQRAYRMGSTEQYRQSGVTAGFMRLVKKDGACLACLLLDGERFNLEDELDDHPNGRCTAVPVVEGVDPPSWEFGKDWFENLSEEKQREIMGDTRYDKWQNGTPLDSFVGKHQNDTWGPSPRINPLSELEK